MLNLKTYTRLCLFMATIAVLLASCSNPTAPEPERIILNDDIALDGPLCIQGNTLWFASFRVGNYGADGDVYTAVLENGKWKNCEN